MNKTNKTTFRKLVIVLLLTVSVLSGCMLPFLSQEKFSIGRYSSWNWTPDGRIIFVATGTDYSRTKGLGAFGYSRGGTTVAVCVMNADGSDLKILHKVYEPSIDEKRIQREKDLRKQGLSKKEAEYQSYRDLNEEKFRQQYAPALSRIGWLDWNASTNQLVFVANDGKGQTGIAVSDPEFREVRWINYEGAYPRWSPDGKWIAYTGKSDFYGDRGDIYLMDAEGQNRKQITKGYVFRSFDWFRDGRKILGANDSLAATKGDEFKGAIVDIETGEVKRVDYNGALSPSGEWVAYYAPGLRIKNLKTGERIDVKHGANFPKWSPDGKMILDGWEGGLGLYRMGIDKESQAINIHKGDKK